MENIYIYSLKIINKLKYKKYYFYYNKWIRKLLHLIEPMSMNNSKKMLI